MIPEPRPNRFLHVAVLGLISLSFLNMLYCSLAYEFGWGPNTILQGPRDRFADVIKLSLSFRNVTNGVDRTDKFQTWRPIYQGYYEHPDYGGAESLAVGNLTHFHHPPLSILLFQMIGLFIVKTGSPTLTLYVCFGVYLLEACFILWIGIPPARRTQEITFAVFFFCLASYPALMTFGRANYVNAGLTTLPIVAFLVATFAKKQPSITALLALAVAVNIHPNAIIFLMALPLAFGVARAVKPALQFFGIAAAILVLSYFAAHELYPAYTLATFRQGLAIYEKIYVARGAGVGSGSSLYGLVFIFNRGFHFGMAHPLEMKVFWALALLIFGAVWGAYWRAARGIERDRQPTRKPKTLEVRHAPQSDPNGWPLPLAPFLLVSSYCILSPVFADYHLLVFLAPIILLCIEPQEYPEARSRLVTLVLLTSVIMLSPKNYSFIQIVLNPAVLCYTLWRLSTGLLSEGKQTVNATAVFKTADGQ